MRSVGSFHSQPSLNNVDLVEVPVPQGQRVVDGWKNAGLPWSYRLDPAKMIQVDDIAELAAQAVLLPRTACVVEMTVRPQRSPYR